ncbi:MAG: hypothetical protein ACP5DQ_08165 [Bacteroidales bacterium]
MHQLSKKEKKIAREIIEKGLQTEYKKGIMQLQEIINQWNPALPDHRETYRKLYKTLTDFDKHISFRYDYLSGSKYLVIIAGQLADKVISINDLKEFSDETRDLVIRWSRINEE